ncbi:serine/threonine protein kinase [Escherichia coli]|nr:serine/threonine protein kinase [Escherichia coli]EFN8342449.1 serine/threonine protein kinase [Escherichia coli]
MEIGTVTGSILVRIHVAHLPLSSLFLCILRSHSSWHYPNSPKNGKPALSPHHDWLKTGSLRQNAPLRIWFYPQ